MQRKMMVTILTRNKKQIAQCLAECIPGLKDPNENDETNEKNNFDENNKNC